MPQRPLKIGEVAERVGLSLRTVRYYEEQGLLAPEARTEGGFRLYTEEQVERLELIKHMKPLGFTVQQMRDLLDARDALSGGDPDPASRQAAYERLSGFADDAAERCAELRKQLVWAEDLTRALRRDTRRAAKAVGAT